MCHSAWTSCVSSRLPLGYLLPLDAQNDFEAEAATILPLLIHRRDEIRRKFYGFRLFPSHVRESDIFCVARGRYDFFNPISVGRTLGARQHGCEAAPQALRELYVSHAIRRH
ncbi:hypothetical protein [Burkholderia catarinensis]|uniref:hypothetical protein n=1 Tax=Burkholderia catarinensis TaxID=1108140 RepID=UPI00100833F6|nr:hypothetical protein [Burkholderia catarinensis]